MISIYSISLAYLLGIYWGIYAKISSLCMSLIFLVSFMFIIMNVFEKKGKKFPFGDLNNILKVSMLLSFFCIVGAIRADLELYKFDYKYIESDSFKSDVTILTHREESNYYYKYTCSMKNNERLILMFKKANCQDFKIGDTILVCRKVFVT